VCSFALSSYQRLRSCFGTLPYIFDCRYFIHMCGFPPSSLVQHIYRGFVPSLWLTLLTLYPSFIHTDVLFRRFCQHAWFCSAMFRPLKPSVIYFTNISFLSAILPEVTILSPRASAPCFAYGSVTPMSDDCVKFIINNRRKLGQHASQSRRGACS